MNRPQIREASLITDKFGLKKDSYILFLGRLVPEKGIRYLVEAFENVKTDKKLVIAGGSSDTDSFMEELKELAKGDDRILFTGFVQGAMLDELYSNAYIYTLPSDLEGMPLSLLEAMSYGKSSNYGATLEYLIFKHDELRKTPILDQKGNRIMRDEYYLDGLNCEPYSFDAACQQLNREYQKNKNKNEIKSHHYIISFDPQDSTENCLTGKRAQELGLEYAKANFPGHQALVCTHMDGHNGSGNIHVHIVINSLRKLDVPKQPFMERPIDCKAGYKHHVTNEYLKHLQKSLMDLCRREFLHQVDLLSPSRTGVTEVEYWAQRRLDEKKQKIETEGFTPNPTKFQTQKQLIRDAVAAAREKAISYEDFQDILQDEYNIFVKTQRGRYSYLPPERNKFISERSLGESCKRECLEGFFVQNAEKNLRYKEDPILIFTTRTIPNES